MMAYQPRQNPLGGDQPNAQQNTVPLPPSLARFTSYGSVGSVGSALANTQQPQQLHPLSPQDLMGAHQNLLLAARLRAAAQQEAQMMHHLLQQRQQQQAQLSGASFPLVQTNQSIQGPGNLELLRSASLGQQRDAGVTSRPGLSSAKTFDTIAPSASAFRNVDVGGASKAGAASAGLPKPSTAPPTAATLLCQREVCGDGEVRLYINEILEWDVLCGRGGRSNHHPGNKRYRHVVSEMKQMYRTTEAKNMKTDLSRAIVEHVCNYGGRFIKKDKTGRYYVLTKAEARKKTSQALRETKQLKWTL